MKTSDHLSLQHSALLGYPIAASAALLASSQQADAQVLYSGLQDLAVAQFTATELDIDGDATGDILLKNYVFGGNYQGATVKYDPGKLVGFTTGLNYASLLSAGDTIDATTTAGGPFTVSLAYANNADSQFDTATNGYLGLTFPISGNNHFAWIRVSIDNAAGSFTVHDWAYELTPDVGITAGATVAIPEASNLGLLAAGAVGLAALRKRRRRSA